MVPIWALVSTGTDMTTVQGACPERWHPTIHRGSVNEARGTACESSRQKWSSSMKYGVFANLITGKQLFSSHRTKAAADKACVKAGKKGASFVVLPIKK